jgi:hypothetical protein
MSSEKYYSTYKDNGFHFPKSLLTTYALSLHTKPFVILSGISGTGKTKIAQLFKIPNEVEEITVKADVGSAEKLSLLIIKVPVIYERFNFPYDVLKDILSLEDTENFNEKAKEFRDVSNEGNFSDTYILDIDDEFGSFQIGVYGQRASSPLIRGRFYKSKQDKKNPNYDARKHLLDNYKPGDVLQLEKVSDKKFKVKTVNNEEVVKEVRDHELLTIQRHCFISVRSDWTDNTELFGFYNLIEQKYHVPYFLNFLLTALNNPKYPFFVILDEMNLSKVEHYFSDVLSCLESRVLKNGEIHQEKVILYNGLSQLLTDTEDFEYIPNAIEIPLNLYITGTVNIDESTYMFSPKVLDRANVIEFNEVNLKTYGNNSYTEDAKGDLYKLSKFPDFSKVALATKKNYQDLPELIKDHLVEINSILEKCNLHFGYRTANEVALYILNAMENINKNQETQLQALDHQFIQKIFPKINGGYATLEAPLNQVLLYLSGKDSLSKIDAANTNFPKTVSKLQRMHQKLSMTGYTSFID